MFSLLPRADTHAVIRVGSVVPTCPHFYMVDVVPTAETIRPRAFGHYRPSGFHGFIISREPRRQEEKAVSPRRLHGRKRHTMPRRNARAAHLADALARLVPATTSFFCCTDDPHYHWPNMLPARTFCFLFLLEEETHYCFCNTWQHTKCVPERALSKMTMFLWKKSEIMESNKYKLELPLANLLCHPISVNVPHYVCIVYM